MNSNKNNRTLSIILFVVAAMVGMSFAAVPLYKVFCRMTGYGGTTQVSAVAPTPDQILERSIEVRFNAGTGPGLNWDFKPDQRKTRVKLGAQGLTTFSAKNLSNGTISAVAVYNVSPAKAGQYFHKIQCFCFGEQSLKPGEKVEYPVVFFVDPSLDKDPNMQDVETITLSYTFFQKDDPKLDKAIENFYATPVQASQPDSKAREKAWAGTVALPPEKQ
ncbi:MAG: ctaG [Micavibrio sp.]|nr:ctaG [Micavibrio sp.]